MYESIWFFGGAIIYATLRRLLNITKPYLFFHEVHLYVLTMLEVSSKNLELACDIKEDFLKETEIPEDSLKEIKSADEKMIALWREASVQKTRQNLPAELKEYANYNSWSEMIRYLDKHTDKIVK